jgi:hypothetical protein
MPLSRSLRVCSLTHKFVGYLPSVELQALLEQHRKAGTVGDTLLVLQVQMQLARVRYAVRGVSYSHQQFRFAACAGLHNRQAWEYTGLSY